MMRSLINAIGFLSILPGSAPAKEADMGRSLRYFPAAGFIISLTGVLAVYISGGLPGPVRAVIALITLTIITGAIHIDGFADTCDGLYGGKDKEGILRIMRDSHLGTMGVLGLVLLILFKFSILATLSTAASAKMIIVSCVFSRWTQVASCVLYPYARAEGKAASFIKYASRKELIYATLFALGLIAAFLGVAGLFVFAAALVPVFLFMNYIRMRIGGQTGDTIGAVSELGETAIMLSLLIYFRLWNIY